MKSADAPTTGADEAAPSLSFGIALVLVAIFFLVFATGIRRSALAGEADPGPRALPVTISVVLLVGGVIEAAASMIRSRRLRPLREVTTEAADDEASTPAPVSHAGLVNAILLVAALAVYLTALPWLGFLPASWLFAAGMLIRLGARGWTAGLMAALLVGLVQVLFVGLFQVQLPRGFWF